MRIKTIVILVLAVIVAVILFRNYDSLRFNTMLGLTGLSFITGILVGYPSKAKNLSGEFPDKNEDTEKTSTLSDEDREYIN